MEMRTLLTILFIFLIQNVFATTYYVASNGSDSNNGTSTSSTWNLAKVNSFTFSPGDNILFNRGDVFYGTITVNQSGTPGNPITYGAYGSGNNPIITGFTTVAAWSNLGSNIWESTSTVSSLTSCKMVTINGVNTAAGRYPNTGWLTYQSHVAGTSITSTSITSATDWTGATAVIKKFRYVVDVVPITSQSGSTLTYSGSSGYDGQDGYGFFIENDVRTLDQQNEWYYNPTSNKIRVYSTTSPTGVNVASLDNLFYAVNKSYIIVNGIDFTGANADCFYIGNFANSTIENCHISFSLNGIGGYQFGGSSANLFIQNNTINHSGNDGISLTSEFAGTTISGNTIKNTGLLEGMALSGQTRWAINTSGANYTIDNNEIDSTGYNAVGFNGSNILVDKNFVNYFCLTNDDGAGIYTGNPQSGVVISNNIVLNGIGNYSGSTYTTPAANGIYCDDNSSGMTLLNNSIANIPFAAIFLHKAKNITVRGNTTFNAHVGLLVDRDDDTAHTTGISVHKNTFIGNSTGSMNTLPDQISEWFKTGWTTAGDIAAFGTCDSNIVARPIDDGNTIMGTIYTVADTYYTLSSWRSYSGYDLHSTKSPKTVSSPDSVSFVYNSTGSAITSTLPYKYLDIAGNTFDGTITLQPYTSAVLIQNGTKTNAAPTISVSGNQTITIDSTSVSAVGTAASGETITDYAWTVSSGTGTFGSPTSASTTVTGLSSGSNVLRCTVTQTDAQTAYKEVTITVNFPAPTANAGTNQTITLPVSSANLSGSATVASGQTATYLWTKISGSGTQTITGNTTLTPTVSGMTTSGDYVFQLKVTQTDNQFATSTVTIHVNPAVVPQYPYVTFPVPIKIIQLR
jgi:parallel beta-helix repeat protein